MEVIIHKKEQTEENVEVSKNSMLTLQKLIHVPINLRYCLKAIGCQVLWFFSFCQQMGLTVSPLLYLMWPLYGATSVRAQCQGSSVPSPVTPHLFREARVQGTRTYFLLRPALEALENKLSVMEAPLLRPGRVEQADTAISLTALIFLPPLFPSSFLGSGTSIQWLKMQTFKLAWTLADLTFATSTSHQALPVFPPKYLWNRPPSLPSAGASWLEPLASHLSFWGSLLLGTRASGPAPLKSILCTAVRIILLKCKPGYPTRLKSNSNWLLIPLASYTRSFPACLCPCLNTELCPDSFTIWGFCASAPFHILFLCLTCPPCFPTPLPCCLTSFYSS